MNEIMKVLVGFGLLILAVWELFDFVLTKTYDTSDKIITVFLFIAIFIYILAKEEY